MKKNIISLLFMATSLFAFAQNNFKAVVTDSIKKEKLPGVTVLLKGSSTAAVSDSAGSVEVNGIPNGIHSLVFKFPGYVEKTCTFSFPLADSVKTSTITICLIAADEELEEVVISTTRTSRSIQNAPTRVEAIEEEEVDEKNNMRPANVSMLLHESTGIQVQQTSATSANASIRIQGLDGRYTQLLKDGCPNFGNFSNGLSILEIPPLDLKQVEVIKGPASPLYGGGAIAGVVNFISKTPEETGAYHFLINQSHIGQSNVGAFLAKRKEKAGYTLLASYNYQRMYDVDKDDFTELPETNDFTIHPKLFLYVNKKKSIVLGNNFTKGKRDGGDVQVLSGKADSTHTYFELNKTVRNISTLDISRQFTENNVLKIKTSFSIFNRSILTTGFLFEGINYNSFSDISYAHTTEKHTLVAGLSYVNDKFRQKSDFFSTIKKDFLTQTGGMYLQHTWDASEKFKLESGLRADVVNYGNKNYADQEFFLLPRVSMLLNISKKLSSRIGGGLGYKAPTTFTEQTEALQYKNILPLYRVSCEKSYGGTADLNFKTSVSEDVFFSINHMFFYTTITNSAILQTDTGGYFSFTNTDKPVYSRGFESNLKFIYKEHFKLFIGYTYTDARAKYLNGNQYLRLLPRNKINLALIYEKEKNFKAGLEAYFTDQQYLNNGLKSSAYWELGIMMEKIFKKIAVYINFENFTDTRQSRFKRVVNDPHHQPTFDEIWTHTEGFVVNGGIKIRL